MFSGSSTVVLFKKPAKRPDGGQCTYLMRFTHLSVQYRRVQIAGNEDVHERVQHHDETPGPT